MQEQPVYAGFWLRLFATLIDTALLMFILGPILAFTYGWAYFESSSAAPAGLVDVLVSHVLPAVAVIAFWIKKQATPGKMLLGLRIVDAGTGGNPSPRQHVLRYLFYHLSALPLCLGFLWVAWDAKKQGWHDKIAGTVVVKSRAGQESAS